MKTDPENKLSDSDFDIWKVSFTRDNAIRAKKLKRKRLARLPINEKIRIVESLRKRAAVLRSEIGKAS